MISYIKWAENISKHKQSKTYHNVKKVHPNFKYAKIIKWYKETHHNLTRDWQHKAYHKRLTA
jgi:hypothetical protein